MKDFYEEPNESEPSFSLKDFKKWMSQQNQQSTEDTRKYECAGLRVESKLSLKKLVTKMLQGEGTDLVELAREFRRYGGTILESDKENVVLVEVDSGTFYIHRFFVRKIKE